MLSALTITPPVASARRSARADLPLAVGPALMNRALTDASLAWPRRFGDSPRHGPDRVSDRRSGARPAWRHDDRRPGAGARRPGALAGARGGLRDRGRGPWPRTDPGAARDHAVGRGAARRRRPAGRGAAQAPS